MTPEERIAELEAELARHRIFADSVKDYALIEFSEDNRITSWSRGAEQLTGWTEAEVLGQPASIIFTPEDRARGEVEKELETALRDGCAEDERWHLKKDGSRFWASGVLTPLSDRAGFAKVMRDLTRRKRDAEALRISEENHRLFIENVRDHALFQVDTGRRICVWNTGAERIFGYSDGEILGQPFSVLFKPEDQKAGYPEDELARAESSGHVEDQRWLVRRDGSHFFAHWVTHLVRDDQGQNRGFAKVLRDDTERLRAENERARLQQLERDLLAERVETADAALDRTRQELRQLAASLMSAQEDERRRVARELHDDLAQRLAALEIGLVQLRRLPESAVEEWRTAVDLLIGDVGALSAEVRNLSHRLHPSVLDDLGLDAALRQLVADLERSAGLTVRLSTSLGAAPTMPGIVAAALYRIAQEALRNIMRHAKDALVSVRLAATPAEVRLSVQDDGPGMDLAQVRFKGGLGLVSMRERANLAGGSLEIKSAPGQGTIVIAVVPCWWADKAVIDV